MKKSEKQRREELIEQRRKKDLNENNRFVDGIPDEGSFGLSNKWFKMAQKGNNYFNAEQYQKALEFFSAAINMDPGEAGSASTIRECKKKKEICIQKLKKQQKQ